MKLHCVIYQKIRLNELYKLIKKNTFFQISIYFLKFLAVNHKIFKRIGRQRGVNIDQIAIQIAMYYIYQWI